MLFAVLVGAYATDDVKLQKQERQTSMLSLMLPRARLKPQSQTDVHCDHLVSRLLAASDLESCSTLSYGLTALVLTSLPLTMRRWLSELPSALSAQRRVKLITQLHKVDQYDHLVSISSSYSNSTLGAAEVLLARLFFLGGSALAAKSPKSSRSLKAHSCSSSCSNRSCSSKSA